MAILSPFTKLSVNLDSTAATTINNNVCLIGFATDTSSLTVNINEPVDLGTITSVSNAVSKLKDIGLRVSMTGLTTYDRTNTDEICQMVIQAIATYQAWVPYMAANTLNPPRIIIGILDNDVNDRIVITDAGDPSNDRTPYGDFFQDVIDQEIELDVIVPSYEYQAGDNDLSNSYLSELKEFVDTQLAKANPNLGFLCPIFHINLSKQDSLTDIGDINILRSVTVVTYQDTSSTSDYQIGSAAVGSIMGIVISSLPGNCEGLVFQNIPNMPKALELGYYTADNIEDFLQKGLSPIVYNKRVSEQQFNRVVTSTLLDPNLGVQRSNGLDIQEYKSVYALQLAIYNSLISNRNIINKRTVIVNGQPSTVTAVRKVVLGELVRAKLLGTILEPTEGFNSTVECFINPDNVNQIILRITIYPSSLLLQIDGEITVEDTSSIFSEFLINL